jgi:Lantibiotic biosynthesis dehydratase C-term
MTPSITPATARPPEPAPGQASGRAAGPGDWIAMHIYYAATPQPLLAQCVAPLIQDLRETGLLENYFYINYWLEGPHVRLRLRPVTPAASAEVCRRTEEAVSSFLRQRPALYSVETGFLSELYNTLFDLEVEEIERAEYVGTDGRMNVRPNNSFAYLPYHPEYQKYGGPAGVALAEWHFQQSSDLVLDAMRTLNLHLRTVTLGTAAQLMMVLASCFIPAADDLAEYFRRYHVFWHRTFAGTDLVGERDYGDHFAASPGLPERLRLIREAVTDNDTDRLPQMLAAWAEHGRELRDRITTLATAGELVFGAWDDRRDERVTDPVEARTRLLSPYLHMTNNRLHMTIRDEAYLSAMLAQGLRAITPDATR